MPRLTYSLMRSRTIVAMLRYSTTSCSSDKRPWPGIDHGAAFVDVAGDGDVHDRVQRVDVAIDGAAVGHVDKRIHHGREEIARGDHVRLPEEHHAVAVGVRVRLMDDLHSLPVEQELAPLGDEGLGRPRPQTAPAAARRGSALRRFSTFSCAMMAAVAVAAAPRSPTTLPPARKRPALEIASLPPM